MCTVVFWAGSSHSDNECYHFPRLLGLPHITPGTWQYYLMCFQDQVPAYAWVTCIHFVQMLYPCLVCNDSRSQCGLVESPELSLLHTEHEHQMLMSILDLLLNQSVGFGWFSFLSCLPLYCCSCVTAIYLDLMLHNLYVPWCTASIKYYHAKRFRTACLCRCS